MTPAVRAHDLFCLYRSPGGDVAALRGLTLDVDDGERVVVHGPNGSGKSTLLRVLTGEQRPSAGSVSVGGVDLVGAEERVRAALRSSTLGVVDQHHARTLRPELDVRDNVALQLRLQGMRAPAARARVDEVLGRLGLAHLGDRRPATLSGGEAQRVAVCAAVAHRPRVVLADEPTGELDREAADAVYDLLARAVAEVGATLLLVSHDPHAARVADRVVRIRDGRLSEQWSPHTAAAEVLVVDDRGWVRLPERLRRDSGTHAGVRPELVDGGLMLRPVHSGPGGAAAPPAAVPEAATLPAGPSLDADGGAPVATMSGVTRSYGDRRVLDGFGLTVPAATLVVVRGRSGAGKSTVLRLLTGLERPDKGDVTVMGIALGPLDRAARADLRRRHVGFAGQQGALAETLDVDENLELSRAVRRREADAGEPGAGSHTDRWVEALGLVGVRHRPARVLSGGERQRLSVGRALCAGAELVVLDEPTSQLDEATAERLAAVLAAVAGSGTAVVTATHDPVVVAAAHIVVDLA